MAEGYLDLLQRELRQAVVQNFADNSALLAVVGVEGQIAYVAGTGHLYVWHDTSWRRLVDFGDIAEVATRSLQVASAFRILIPDGSAGYLNVVHGLMGPATTVHLPDGTEVEVTVKHDLGGKSTSIEWDQPLDSNSYIVIVGSKVLAGISG